MQMTRVSLARTAIGLGFALLILAAGVHAADVTISFVTEKDGKVIPLREVQSLWRSPFGGWVVTTWPFGLRVDDVSILEYRSAFDKLMKDAESVLAGSDALLDELTDDLLGTENAVDVNDLLTFRFDRPSEAIVTVDPGRHRIHPWELTFTVGDDNKITADDPTLRVAGNGRRLEILCHPVKLRVLAGGKSIPFPMSVTCGRRNMLGGLTKPIEEFERKAVANRDTNKSSGYRCVTIYLPSSSAEQPYALNNNRFAMHADGHIEVGADGELKLAGEREIHAFVPPLSQGETRHIGLRWFDAKGGISASVGNSAFTSDRTEGSACLTADITRFSTKALVDIGARRQRPVAHVAVSGSPDKRAANCLLYSGRERACWIVESGQLVVKPSDEITMRILPANANATELGDSIVLTLVQDDAVTTGKGIRMSMGAQTRGEYTGRLPGQVTQGTWKLVAGPKTPLAGQALGMIYVSPTPPKASVSLYTYRNRGLFLQGDVVDVFWTAKPTSDQTLDDYPVELAGNGMAITVGAIHPGRSQAGESVSGLVRFDTGPLAPGTYELKVKAEDTVCYGTRIRVVQREPSTDYTLYSYVFGPSKANGGLPTMQFFDNAFKNEPGLKPLMEDLRGGCDPAFGAYAAFPGGPAIESAAIPSDDDIAIMALASIGCKVVLPMPNMIHHEDWNPKHTLPEDLKRLRRRVALFTQEHVDTAGFSGIALNWYATLNGYWEESPRLDGHQAKRNSAAGKWIGEMAEKRVEEARKHTTDTNKLANIRRAAAFEARSDVLPTAYGHYLVDANVIKPGLTSHTGIPSFWLGGGSSYAPVAYSTLTHRDSVDYTDYGIAPWGNFRAPAFLNMGNPDGQKTFCCYATAGRHSRIVTAFGAAGRGLDGLSLSPDGDGYNQGEDGALLQIFEKFGSYFTALDPLPDVAVYYSPFAAWANQKSVVLHDLARLRRPGMLLSPEDVTAGKLQGHRVLFLVGVTDREQSGVLKAFEDFQAGGGVILKDQYCSKSLPGHDIGFAYSKEHVHKGWGLAYPNGEWEFAHLWTNFREKREEPLLKAFAKAPPLPIGTPDHDVLISPLGNEESVCCFVVNQTYVPMSVDGKWRQHAVLPCRKTLRVPDGWTVRDLLLGTECKVKQGLQGSFIDMDFTRMEGGLYLLTKRRPVSISLQCIRTEDKTVRITAWLNDAEKKPLPGPMPFEVTLTGPNDEPVFHKYAALSPQLALDIPVPALAESPLRLTVHDMASGYSASRPIKPANVNTLAIEPSVDVIGREHVRSFLGDRKGPVSVMLDKSQNAYGRAADAVVTLLKQRGRDARTIVYDPAAVRLLPLRWYPIEEDLPILDALENGRGIAWRVNLAPWNKLKETFKDPALGYHEYGPRTWFEGDVVLFGAPANHLALRDLEPYLRRVPSASYPSAEGFFIHYLWDPFSGGHDGLYLGCNDAAGAEAAVKALASLAVPKILARSPLGKPETTTSSAVGTLENFVSGRFGSRVLDIGYAPDNSRIFVTLNSYGDSFFVLSPDGKVITSRPLGNRCGNNLWYRKSGQLDAIDAHSLRLKLWSNDYLYDLDKGFVSRATSPHHGFLGRFKVNIAGPTLYKDKDNGRTYVGGKRFLRAIDAKGHVLWTYDDSNVRTGMSDMLDVRALFIRGTSPDGKYVLVSGFGVRLDCYSIGGIVNQSVFCVDAQSGECLWTKDGLLLNEGKVIPLDDRFIVVADDGQFHVLANATGQAAGSLRPVGGNDWILPLPGGDKLLVVENNHFDRAGPTSRTYLRPFGSAPDKILPISGRVTDAVIAPDRDAILITSERGHTTCFSLTGTLLWDAETPSGGIVRPSPDSQTVLVGTRDGQLLFLDRRDGSLKNNLDMNPFNVTSGQQFVEQLSSIGDVPPDETATLPPLPPEPSYLNSLARESVTFGPNLVDPGAVKAAMSKAAKPDNDPAMPSYVAGLTDKAEFRLQVKAGSTYLIEMLTAADKAKVTPQTRLEISITGSRKSPHLPFVARLPLNAALTMQRVAFRADSTGTVTLGLRAVIPHTEGEGRRAKTSYTKAETVNAEVIVADLVVASMNFVSRNLILEQGPASRSTPRGSLECEVKPWTGGNSTIRSKPYPAPQQALRMVDGVIANQETAWTTESKGSETAYAQGLLKFTKPTTVSAVAVYEDNSGPVPSAKGVQERTAIHFGIYVHDTKTKQWKRVGYAADNMNLVNVFTFPAIVADQLKYYWAGRNDSGKTDGIVRTVELEVYSNENFTDILDGLEEDEFDLGF